MMTYIELCFWVCAGVTAYTFVGYPLMIGLLARIFGRTPRRDGSLPRSLTLVMAAHNEEKRIGPRLREMQTILDAAGIEGEIILVSNGSTDRTVEAARKVAGSRVRILTLAEKVGKAASLTEASIIATGEILVFADVRQHWPVEALPQLLETFADPTVGAVSGDLVLESAPGVLAGVGLYWRYEKWLRCQESTLFSMVGATGAISAVRKHLFRPIPQGTILDDVYWPLQVAMQGYRVVHNSCAHAYDRLPPRTQDEMRRKVRTLTGNFQLLTRLPGALLPWRNPIWVQLISHKVLRLLVPWCLLTMLLCSALLPGILYKSLFWLQTAFYALGLAGTTSWVSCRIRLSSAAASFLVLNTASWLAFWVWISGREAASWHKVAYEKPGTEASSATKDTRNNAAEDTRASSALPGNKQLTVPTP